MGLLGISFGCLAALSAWAVWRESEWRWIGAALVASYAASNVVKIFGDIDAVPAVYTGVEIIVALMAFAAMHTRYHRAALALMCVSFISIYCNILLAASHDKGGAVVNAHELRTNVLFAIECFITSFVGARQRGVFDRWLGVRRDVDTDISLAKEASDR